MRGSLALSLFALACLVPVSMTSAQDESHPEPLVFHSTDEMPANRSMPSIYATPFFERKYSTGWFTSPVILNMHVETSQLLNLLITRKKTHYPKYVTAHCVEYPRPIVLFNVLWVPNSANWRWTLVVNMEGADFQPKLDDLMSKGQNPAQLDSYSFTSHGTIYYASTFIAKQKWEPGTDFDISFGLPNDGSVCCGPSSRWETLRSKGFKPLSVSLTQDPATGGVYVSDIWNTKDVAFWQGNFDLRPGELQSLLAALAPPLVPFFVKSYRVMGNDGSQQFFYSYIADSDPSIPSFAATIDISRSGIELLATVMKSPPLFVSSFYSPGEIDPQDPTSGDMYAAVWQQMAPSIWVLPKQDFNDSGRLNLRRVLLR